MSDLAFEKLLADHSSAFAEAEAFDDWMPGDGEYNTLIVDVKRGSYTKNDTPVPYWRVTGQIQDPALPEYDQKEYSLGYFTPASFRGLKTLVNALTGTQINSLAAANEALDTVVGMLVKTRVKSNYSEKYKKDFTNVTIQSVIPTDGGIVEQPTEPVGDPATASPPETVA